MQLADLYPFEPPTITFENRIYHPNIDLKTGTVCLNVLSSAWTPIYSKFQLNFDDLLINCIFFCSPTDLTNIFEHFLPQLLAYPNGGDPVHGDAAALFLDNREHFNERVKRYVTKFASEDNEPEAVVVPPTPEEDEESSDLSELSDDDS